MNARTARRAAALSSREDIPTASRGAACVSVWTEELVLPTYMPAAPDRNPMFLEKRVYQGSSGKVYPLPFTDRIAEKPVDRKWKAVWLENEYLKVLILPELGGRIHRALDKTNGYDFIYHQPVIKPALVGLAGPWISGGIEFNWPQHNRPATFLPVDYFISEEPGGGKIVWCSDHDPMARMKGMHGICLRPGKAFHPPHAQRARFPRGLLHLHRTRRALAHQIGKSFELSKPPRRSFAQAFPELVAFIKQPRVFCFFHQAAGRPRRLFC